MEYDEIFKSYNFDFCFILGKENLPHLSPQIQMMLRALILRTMHSDTIICHFDIFPPLLTGFYFIFVSLTQFSIFILCLCVTNANFKSDAAFLNSIMILFIASFLVLLIVFPYYLLSFNFVVPFKGSVTFSEFFIS